LSVVALPVVPSSAPPDGPRYGLDAVVPIDYSWNRLVAGGIQSRSGHPPAGSLPDTSRPGPHTFTVSAVDNQSDVSTKTITYTVVAPPTISITSPPEGASYRLGASVAADYSCSSHDGSLLACAGDLPLGRAVDTNSIG